MFLQNCLPKGLANLKYETPRQVNHDVILVSVMENFANFDADLITSLRLRPKRSTHELILCTPAVQVCNSKSLRRTNSLDRSIKTKLAVRYYVKASILPQRDHHT